MTERNQEKKSLTGARGGLIIPTHTKQFKAETWFHKDHVKALVCQSCRVNYSSTHKQWSLSRETEKEWAVSLKRAVETAPGMRKKLTVLALNDSHHSTPQECKGDQVILQQRAGERSQLNGECESVYIHRKRRRVWVRGKPRKQQVWQTT